jgi:hypothetical protein
VAVARAKALKITTVTPIERRDHMQEQEPVVHAAEPYLHLRRTHGGSDAPGVRAALGYGRLVAHAMSQERP